MKLFLENNLLGNHYLMLGYIHNCIFGSLINQNIFHNNICKLSILFIQNQKNMDQDRCHSKLYQEDRSFHCILYISYSLNRNIPHMNYHKDSKTHWMIYNSIYRKSSSTNSPVLRILHCMINNFKNLQYMFRI